MLGFERDVKTVRIPVVFKEGRIQLWDGREFPKIRNESYGEIVLSEYAVKDPDLLQELQAEVTVEMLKEGVSVFLSVMADKVSPELWKRLEIGEGVINGPEGPCVEVRLEDPLKLRLRGSKNATLCSCRCSIPALRGLEARSLNHAYTLISRRFEKQRISHAGNVFRLGYWRDKSKETWVRLEELRVVIETKHRLKDIS